MIETYDTIIVGQGLAGTTLGWKLIDKGQRVLVIDANDGSGASRVAAGLMTPVTGKRMVCSPDFEEEWEQAVRFYQAIEDRLGRALLTEEPMIRLFDREEDRQAYLDRSEVGGRVRAFPWEGRLEAEGETKLGVKISPAGRLRVSDYLEASRRAFEALRAYRAAEVMVEDDVIFGEQISVPKLEVAAAKMVLCQGARENLLFPGVPNNPAKGEIHRYHLRQMSVDQVVHRSIWLAPDVTAESLEKYPTNWFVGATYDWDDFQRMPTAKAEAELKRKLGYLLEQEAEVGQKLVGVRPTMKDRQPVLGQHPVHSRLWIFNGLGSKGALKSPLMANRLVSAMEGAKVPTEISYQRLLAEKRGTIPLTTVAQQKIEEIVEEGDLVVDATVGRGFDTSFLSKRVGSTGSVLGFDVQLEALKATEQRLKSFGAANVELFHQGHESVGEALDGRRVRAAMFNLGYLPGSDKTLITKAETTLKALAAVYEALLPGGRMTLLCYRGHDGGAEEYEAVASWVNNQSPKELERIDSPVAKATAPVLLVVTKVRSDREALE